MNKKKITRPLALQDYKRLVVIAFSLFVFFCFLIIQFYKLQIIEKEKWTKQALCQHRCLVTQPFMRGRFFSNNTVVKNYLEEGQPFVSDVLKFHLFIDSRALPKDEKEKIANEICLFFDLKKEEKIKVKEQFYKDSRSRKIIGWLDSEKKNNIEKWWDTYRQGKKIPKNAIFFIQDFKRSYPFGVLSGQLLSSVREEKDDELQSLPIGGLELYFNDYLKGQKGIKEIIRSPRNPMGVSNVIQRIENGSDVYLTINQYIQAILEEELEKGVKRLKAKGAWAVMMDPKTGEILLWASILFSMLQVILSTLTMILY
jgi:cell division protein FtsI (penicillin-binding protein 3)